MERLRAHVTFSYSCANEDCDDADMDMDEKEMLQHFHRTKHPGYNVVLRMEA